jgi:hypothetical protein
MLKKEEEILVAVKERQAKVKKLNTYQLHLRPIVHSILFIRECRNLNSQSCCLNLLII